MGHWNKVDWFCPDCGNYWMTTENCAPTAHLNPDCDCQEVHHKPHSRDAVARCHSCGQNLEEGNLLCCHLEERSLAV